MTAPGLSIAPGATVPPRMLARHMGIFGATGTGKTTTLGTVIERAPCPVLAIDAKTKQFFVEYRAADGRATEDWFHDDQIEVTGAPVTTSNGELLK